MFILRFVNLGYPETQGCVILSNLFIIIAVFKKFAKNKENPLLFKISKKE